MLRALAVGLITVARPLAVGLYSYVGLYTCNAHAYSTTIALFAVYEQYNSSQGK